MRALAAGAAVAAVALLLAGCAQGQGARAGGDAAGAPTSTAPASTSPPTSPPPTRPPTSTAPGRTGTSSAGTLVVRGTLRQGVEPGCLLLDTQDRHAYLLVDVDPAKARAGARVEVVGQPLDQLASFCGEGMALSVVSVRALG
jgi:hypothetical protein